MRGERSTAINPTPLDVIRHPEDRWRASNPVVRPGCGPGRRPGWKPWGRTLGRRGGRHGTLGSVELVWLETLLAVVDRGGFTAASATLHRSQSRVSAHVAALERELGVRLFDRSRRPTTLTPAGEVFLPYARAAVQNIASAKA